MVAFTSTARASAGADPRRRADIVWRMLIAVGITTSVFSAFALSVGLGLVHFSLGGPQFTWERSLLAGVGTSVCMFLLAELYHSRSRIGVNVVTACVSVLIVAVSPGYGYAHSLPQVVWLGPILAFMLTSLRFSLFTTALTFASVYVFHEQDRVIREWSPVFVAVAITAVLMGARVRHDAILADQRAQSEATLQAAFYDALTGLPNRRLLSDRLLEALKLTERKRTALAVLFVDIDHFKQVNETLGHDQGDALLLDAVRRVRRCVRASDTLARFGADVFTIVLSDVSDRTSVDRVAAEVLAELGQGYTLASGHIAMTASIGIAMFPEDGSTRDALIQRADQALHVAKAAGGNRAVYYTSSLQAEAEQRLRLTQDLRIALRVGQLAVHYQPIVEMATQRICKAEALVRWKHPELGMVSPAIFIPIAEASGLIHELGDWVLLEAASHVQQLRKLGHSGIQISVNRSPAQFVSTGARGTLGVVGSANASGTSWSDQLRALGLPGDSIALEITEGLLLDKGKAVADELDAVHAAGISISLDDFGTGYSALAYLQRYPIDIVKIDRSFVANLEPGSRNLALCRSIIRMSHDLGMRVVAEGVETVVERDLLMEAGCDFAQGYLFGRPMPADEFQKLLLAQSLN